MGAAIFSERGVKARAFPCILQIPPPNASAKAETAPKPMLPSVALVGREKEKRVNMCDF